MPVRGGVTFLSLVFLSWAFYDSRTWTNYTNAGGAEGLSIPSFATVQIACALTGFKVADGNTWWYQIASSPWNDVYYASADAFTTTAPPPAS